MATPIGARIAALGLASLVACAWFAPRTASAAEATTGTISGSVVDAAGAALAGVSISASSPSGRYAGRSDARGRFALPGVVPDTYAVCAQKAGLIDACDSGVTVEAGQTLGLKFVLREALATIGKVEVTSQAFNLGSTGDIFEVDGGAARAQTPPATSSGLAQYARGTVQGAIANVPGVDLDPFANATVHATKASDTIFDYDSVPIPQGLVAEPGGNIDGAQLLTTGVAATTVTIAGFTSESDNALGALVNQIPAVGTYPARTDLDYEDGVFGGRSQGASLQFLSATPDLRWRYALASSTQSDYLAYGDGRTFYPSEAGTYGLALQSRGSFSLEGNVHFRASARDDVALLGLYGTAQYDQYGSPYSGETVGALDGTAANGMPVTYPGETDPNAPVDYASGVRGSYSVLKLSWQHTGETLFSRVQLYRSRYGSSAGGPFWDENGFPNGTVSLSSNQGGTSTGITYDGDASLGPSRIRFGAEYRVSTSFLSQVVPTADEFITSQPTVDSELAYAGDVWKASDRLSLGETLRFTSFHFKPSNGGAYDTGGIDPHEAVVYRIGNDLALRANVDRQTVAPLPLEADRSDSTNVDANGNPAPFAPLASETANDFSYSLEGRGRTAFRLTYYQQFENDVIDVLPYNFRSAVASGQSPNGLGVPTNAGLLRASGLDAYVRNGGLTLSANLVDARSSSASQFAYNDLNAPAVAAGHLFPVGYVPALTATMSYRLPIARGRIEIVPSLSYESGYPYGNGKMVYVFDSAGRPVRVLNDNYVNPGANYYFLRDPSQPFNAATNPYIGNLGTNEGNDPNTLRSPSQVLANLHLEAHLSPRATLEFDLTNAFGAAAPTAYQNNPYLIGPPGYRGGNPVYAACYAQILRGTTPCAAGSQAGASPYVLGNGVPTNDGVSQSVPWSYGTYGYVPQSYPLARTLELRIRYRL